MKETILGYHIAADADAFASFMAQAQERYNALEQALAPLQEAIRDLERDWKPRDAEFWQRVTGSLPSIQDAVNAIFSLFDKGNEVPWIIAGTAIGYRHFLHVVNRDMEEAGIVLTSYCESSAVTSYNELHLRQRQRVLRALRTLNEACLNAIREAKEKLLRDQQEQQKYDAPRVDQQLNTTEPHLHLVGESETGA